MAARAVPDGMLVFLCTHERTDLCEFLDKCLAAFVAVKSRVFSRALAHRSVRIDDDDLLEMVALPHLEVVRVVGRRHLDRARSECGVDIRIGKERNAPLHHGQDQSLADEAFVALIIRMHSDPRIAEHRLGPRRRDLHIVIRALDLVAEMPEIPLLCLMLHLDVRDRRRAVRAPVRDACALIDQPLLIEAHEHFAHRARAALVHREPLAVPVAGCAEHAQLIHDAVAILLLPVPDTLQKFLTPEFEPVRPLRTQTLLYLCLRGNARMITPRYPDDILAAHALVAHKDILERIVERMPHVQLPRHIRRRDHYAVGRTRLIRVIVK